jgi:hypothetical protein
LRWFLLGAVICVGFVAYRSAELGAPASELHLSPSGLAISTVYQDAVARCQHLMTSGGHPHYCGELAYGPPYEDPPTVARAAQMGVAEFADPSHGVNTALTAKYIDWQWNYQSGLWGGHVVAHWWQSALALRTLMRYLEVTHNTDPRFQTILMRTYERERANPFAIAYRNFANMFGDDTAWWGLAWLEASRYELNVRHDVTTARTFLSLAQYDANYLDKRVRMCGGVEWKIGYPPDTITGAEYATLVAELYGFTSAPGPLQDQASASRWLAQAKQTIAWLQRTGLINLHTGQVRDKLQVGCKQTLGGPLTYTEGQVADALINLGAALHDKTYYRQANVFLRYTLSEQAGFVNRNSGILQEKCERDGTACTADKQFLDIVSWKGILMQALQDYRAATGSTEYDAFVLRQAHAIVKNSILHPNGRSSSCNADGNCPQANGSPGRCDTPADCQFVFYWGWPLSPVRSPFVNDATQMDAIDALTAAMAVDPRAT